MSQQSLTKQWLARRRRGRLVPPSLVAIALFLAFWQVVSLQFEATTFPGLGQLADNIVLVVTSEDQFAFLDNVLPTLVRIAMGFLISMVIGTVLGISMGLYTAVEDYATAPVMAIMTFPAVVWAFMGILWFGITQYVVHVLVITLVVAPYVTVNIWKGAESVDQELVEMAASFDAGRLEQWRHIHVPHLQPFLFSSARLAFALSWKIALVAEVFGATEGVGYVISYYFQTLRSDMIIAWAVPVMLLMFGVERLFKRLEDRSFAWRPELEDTVDRRA
ncbi:ABC transporter permease [Halobacterium bonnevillei]|uniref:ABC transporter permease subunit n=1 Tax=Halobacterium bonnevillei TaxID=2692200 RepID=A0A6B0SGA9_9EURY|nr:ABC transporter permease [Halobacterium bonnevillei]MXR20037.1 ABC transporter permease subunit [Halobacterium bonnevillei]